MPIDTSIALGVRPPQFQTIDPMTIYSAMEDQRLNALRGRALEQEMQRNALIMQNTMEDRRAAAAKAALERRQQEELLRTFRGGYQPAKNPVMGPGTIQGATPAGFDYEGVKNKLIGGGNVNAFKIVSELQEQEANRLKAQRAAENESSTGAKIRAETEGFNLKNIDTQLARISSTIDQALTLDDVYAQYRAAPDALAARGQTPDTAIKAFNDRVAQLTQGGLQPDQAFAQAKMEAAKGAMAVQKQLSDIAATQKPELKNISGMGMVAVNPYTAKGTRVTVDGVPLTDTTSEVPELKKGQRYNVEAKRIDAIPGSDIYISESQKHADDLSVVKAAKVTDDAVSKKIAYILDPANADAFNSNFGGSTYFGSRYFPGETQAMAQEIESLKSEMMAAGKTLMAGRSGAIGTITQSEWPYLERMIAGINPGMPEADARRQIAYVGDMIKTLSNNAKEIYDTTWGATQYYKPTAGGTKDKTDGAASKASATTPSGVPVLNWD